MSSGEAAEQVVRLSMEGAEFALKIAGEGVERIAALLFAALQPKQGGKAPKQPSTKLRGRERLKSMLKSGAELKIFEIQGKEQQMKKQSMATEIFMEEEITALYLRLSRDDDLEGESNSIAKRLSLLIF
jgi:hypothetical protein